MITSKCHRKKYLRIHNPAGKGSWRCSTGFSSSRGKWTWRLSQQTWTVSWYMAFSTGGKTPRRHRPWAVERTPRPVERTQAGPGCNSDTSLRYGSAHDPPGVPPFWNKRKARYKRLRKKSAPNIEQHADHTYGPPRIETWAGVGPSRRRTGWRVHACCVTSW